MSSMSHAFEERLCRVCLGYDRQGNLHYYAFGRYAHPRCMVEKWGLKKCLGMLHAWQRPMFRRQLKAEVKKGQPHPLIAAVEAMRRAKGRGR